MYRLPFRYQVALGPAIIAMTLMGVIGFTLGQFDELQRQNEIIRQWARITDRLHLALSAGHQMRSLSTNLLHPAADRNDLQFSYLEQSRVFSENILYPECMDRLPQDVRKKIERDEPMLRFREDMSPGEVISILDDLLPDLEKLQDTWWLQKRAAYITYYDDVQTTNNRYITIALSLLAVCLLLAGGFTWWTLRTTNTRLKRLAQQTQAISEGRVCDLQAPEKCIDEIDNVSASVSRMTHRLLNVVAVEKVLQGAEDERKRIAMDMHDHVLAELTAVSRHMDALRQEQAQLPPEQLQQRIQQLHTELIDTMQTIRDVIDDLHPHTLEMLGLASAITSLVERTSSGPYAPKYYLSIESDIDEGMDEYPKIMLYRIVQEVVHNILVHAHCTQFEIRLGVQDGQLQLTIEDNGKGFDPKHQTYGHGLININERARAIGAHIFWKASRFTTGNCFELTLILKK